MVDGKTVENTLKIRLNLEIIKYIKMVHIYIYIYIYIVHINKNVAHIHMNPDREGYFINTSRKG